ncbi:[ThiS-adenylate] sulfurtransferase [Franzmannia pantelleriensis]|uniref:tRNA sulfurtransferase n=1 Tax=Franzmannia pantelleriensis TaxID=48727 RepID=A0A1G9M4M8_9GAMM|nr:tRNA uracil 4-sulfurtransferase ThiI [Halomonas pantelleriensis]SDL69114.1 [ThiS-adenylate] sulfurtransferase [Halomonas pantelleriensis]
MRYRIKLFGEITIKSRSVRKEMVRCLRTNIRNTLRDIDPTVRVADHWDALEIRPSAPLDDAAHATIEASLTRIPGIHEVQVVEAHPFTDFATAAERLVPLWREALPGRRFRVSVKRRGQHDFSSEDLERYLGSALLDAVPSARVDLRHPEIDVGLELKDRRLLLVSRRLPGLGGYPLGTQGQALALISGGFDSPVAAWRLMRRGLKTHFVFFNLGGPAHEQGVREVTHHLWQQYSASHRVNFISVPFDGVVDEIQRQVPAGLAGVVLKRMMLRAANRVAARARLPALVTGDALAQVSSQSLANLGLIDAVSERPILRPLVASDKQTIIADARHIGTARFAEALPEYCGVMSHRPHVRPSPAQIEAAEAGFDDAILEAAIAAASMTRSDRLLESAPTLAEIDEIATPGALLDAPDATVIDIRHPDEREAAPLTLPRGEPLAIPFFELAQRAPSLPRRRYLLYCEQGVMSRMQALHLADRGLAHFGVYRGDDRGRV